MNDHDYALVVSQLPPSKRIVYEALRHNGPLDDHQLGAIVDPAGTSGFRGRRRDLVRAGLVRSIGKKHGRTLWALTPPPDVEIARAADELTGPRLRPVAEHPLDVRVNAFLRLADDKEVQDAINDPERAALQRQRSRLKAAIAHNARERRARARELKEAINHEHPSVEAMRFRNALREATDVVRALRVLYDEEYERRTLIGERAVPDPEWERVLRVIDDGLKEHEETYEVVARMIDAPSRRQMDIEIGEDQVTEDAEYELIAGLGEDVTETP